MGHVRVATALAVLGVLVAGCSADSGVKAAASVSLGATETVPSAPTTVASTDGTTTTGVPQAPADESMRFGCCGSFVDDDELSPPSSAWECGTLVVPMDPDEPDGATVHLAVTRLEGRYSEGDALVINPGGPGAPGLPHVWALADVLPNDVRNRYDIVSWDPRGIGKSTPVIQCPRGARWSDIELLGRCGEVSDGLMGYVATPYHVGDLERLRRSLGQERLNYLGYSYGTLIGAQYANRYPAAVGRFVLDGAVDPTAGTARAPDYLGEPWYAVDKTQDVADRFFELCDASDLCDLGPDSAAAFDLIESDIASLPTEQFPGEFSIDIVTLDAVLMTSMFDPFNWGFLATALEDAAAGDGSTIDALADLLEVSPAYFGDLVDPLDREGVASLPIYCADFQTHPRLPTSCGGMPDNRANLTEVGRIDADQPILVIGTAFDPSTPARHAGALALALDDAVVLYWDGVGHTAFPYNSWCVDDTVESFLTDGEVPVDGTRCDFVDGLNDDRDIADLLFALEAPYLEPWIAEVLEPAWGDDAPCAATELVDNDDRILVHIVLGVASSAAKTAIDRASVSCSRS